jgi:repressor LexA|nr:transcriptional repressor LexA [uncultured Romboutsia sp.]
MFSNPNLSYKQEQILYFIKQCMLDKGYPPSIREICDAVGLKSPSTVHSHLSKLEYLGYIRKDPTKPRAIEVLDGCKRASDDNIIGLPLVDQVSIEQSMLSENNIKEHIPLPSNLIKGRNNFIFQIKGDSMVNAGMLDGDFIIVDRKNTISDGEIVLALLYKEYPTVKRFFKDGDKIRLQAENDFMDPIVLDNSQVDIIGIATGVFRIVK